MVIGSSPVGPTTINMQIPIVKKENDKIIIELNERQAEILAMLLGTLSPSSVRSTINDYFKHYDEKYRPALCSAHKPVSEQGWQEQDTMVTGYIHNGLTTALNWHEKYDPRDQDEELTD